LNRKRFDALFIGVGFPRCAFPCCFSRRLVRRSFNEGGSLDEGGSPGLRPGFPRNTGANAATTRESFNPKFTSASTSCFFEQNLLLIKFESLIWRNSPRNNDVPFSSNKMWSRGSYMKMK
jgi:hypothetical protein